MIQELEAFAQVLDAPVRPVCAILGGAKVGKRPPETIGDIGKMMEIMGKDHPGTIWNYFFWDLFRGVTI